MARKTGVFARMLQVFRKITEGGTKKVGEDHLGNSYFLREADPQKDRRERRYMEPANKDDNFQETPVEWEAWLRYRRNEPPTQEELDRNYALTMRTLRRAKEIEEKDSLESGHLPDSQSISSITTRVTSRSEERKFPDRPGLQLNPGVDNEEKDQIKRR